MGTIINAFIVFPPAAGGADAYQQEGNTDKYQQEGNTDVYILE